MASSIGSGGSAFVPKENQPTPPAPYQNMEVYADTPAFSPEEITMPAWNLPSAWRLPASAGTVSAASSAIFNQLGQLPLAVSPAQTASFEVGRHKYKLNECVGSGFYKDTYIVDHLRKTGEEIKKALSIVRAVGADAIEIMNEVEVNKLLREIKKANPQALSFSAGKYVSTADGKGQGIISDFCNKGDVNKIIVGTSKEEKLAICQQMATGIYQLHQAGIIHRDIKPDNFLCHKDTQGGLVIRIADFGKSVIIKGHKPPDLSKMTAVLAKAWLAPEIQASIKERDGTKIKQQSLQEAAEVFQLGMSLYQVLTETPNASIGNELFSGAPAVRKDPEFWPGFKSGVMAPEVAKFILSMVDQDPAKRPPLMKVMEFLTGLKSVVAETPAPAVDNADRPSSTRSIRS